MSIITLLTDFSEESYFVASMKGVILSINPNAKIIDITHNVPRHDIKRAAFILWSCYKYFPKNTIHVVVVDPGVGSERKSIIIKSRNYYFVGPDNGVLTLAAEDDGIEKVFEIIPGKYTREKISTTFHGRDIFAPIAAYLSLGIKPEEIGKEISNCVKIQLPKPEIINENTIKCSVVYIDNFGNVYTSIRNDLIEKLGIEYGCKFLVKFSNGVEIEIPFVETYSKVPEGHVLALINSEEFLEFAINLDNFARKFDVKEGNELIIKILR